ncbi:30S ribosomal protein S9 [Corynebacterium ulceribovis]|uniref:30S ribosomal protein S9 n=1 Tax=Corynebacterium ulceribovis TaxID=487732 RepID=UPI00037FAAA0|nr:30S ribosomal protein S9 [Corynebacterium ulceribovis]
MTNAENNNENVNNEVEAVDAELIAAQVAAEAAVETSTIGEAVAAAEAAVDASEEVAVAEPLSMDSPIQTVGRRKRAIVRVKMTLGSGEITCNGRSLDDYFPNKLHQQLIKDPLVLIEREGQFDIKANLNGGGASGQAGALRLAIARALNEFNPDDRAELKKAGFLTRDARAVERKKAGLHKARRAPQYSKR